MISKIISLLDRRRIILELSKSYLAISRKYTMTLSLKTNPEQTLISRPGLKPKPGAALIRLLPSRDNAGHVTMLRGSLQHFMAPRHKSKF